EGLSYQWKKAQILEEGQDLVIVTAGPLVGKALYAAEKLREQGHKATVINNPFVNEPDVTTISLALSKAKGRLVTVEDHQVIGGMGSLLSHALLRSQVEFKLLSLGMNGEFGRSAYQADHLYARDGIDGEGIFKQITQWL